MANALKSFGERLRNLTKNISDRDELPPNADALAPKRLRRDSEQKAAKRNEWLYNFRRYALGVKYDDKQDEVDRRTYTTRLFNYVHAEFNFNSPRYLGRFARITHLVFTPLYVEKTPGGPLPVTEDAKRIGARTQETLDWLWKEAIHNYRNDLQNPSFRGGKDRIFEFVQELFDFSEPFITTKRSVWDMKKALMRRLPPDDGAVLATKRIEDEIENSGLSNRLTNTIEFFWKHQDNNYAHFKWTRHDRPYQTYTLTHETADGVPDREDPFGKTALEAFPEEIFYGVNNEGLFDPDIGLFGRYVQGANYLIIPVEAFLSDGRISPSNLAARTTSASADKIARALDGLRVKGDGRVLDDIVIASTRNFLHRCFQETTDGEFKHEFVGFKCMDGRAYVFASLRNIYSPPDADVDTQKNLFTRTVIIDCGMNGFQRGRLIQNLTEFATERTLALLWVARFRLIHYALTVIGARLSLAVSNYHNGNDQRDSVVLPEYYDDLTKGKAQPERQRQLIIALEFLSSCLTILNDVVEGGITDRSSATQTAVYLIEGKVKSMRERPIIGHQTLTDFLHRRFVPAARMIGRTGERYNRLRQRIAEISDLTNAHLQAEQRDEHAEEARRQTGLLRVAELFGEVALGYYGAGLIKEFLDGMCSSGVWQFPCAGGLASPLSRVTLYTIALAAVITMWTTSLRHMFKRRRADRADISGGDQ